MSDTPLHIIRGRYLLQQPRQAGGMTTVYQSRDLIADELVAVKRFDRDRHLHEIQREAFLREVEALQTLSHPHVVKLRDFGEDEQGKFFVVLELMKHDLIREFEEGGVAFGGWDDFAELVVLPLLEALGYAHELGIAHRDVKPANVLVADDGTVKLADFGISKLKRTLQPRVTLHEFMSPPFSPPEADSGGFSYSRDVYSMGVLCLWAMSGAQLGDYADIPRALEKLDASTEIREIIARAVSSDPRRRHHSAPLLAAETERVQGKRQLMWEQRGRPRCALGLTHKAMQAAKDELGLTSERDIKKFLQDDINEDSAIQRFLDRPGSAHERTRPGHYSVIGGTFRYHVATNDRGFDNFSLLNVTRPEPHFLQSERQSSARSPIAFSIDSRTGLIGHEEAVRKLEQCLEAFELRKKEDSRHAAEDALFDTWLRVLDARLQFEREEARPIRFTQALVNGSLVTLRLEEEPEGAEVDQGRVIYTRDGFSIRGDVWAIREGELVLNCPGAPLSQMPQSGEAKLDQYALQVAVDRQREAVDQIRAGTCASTRLRELLLDPGSATPPSPDAQLRPEVQQMLDESKCAALRAALGAQDVLLVQGPPGTGKTQFIVGLILEALSRRPGCRILLSSQTHIAIDNALERLAGHPEVGKVVRIARETSTAVSAGAGPFLLTQQMAAWRDEIVTRSNAGLEAWAQGHGLDPSELRLGTLIRQVATLRMQDTELRARLLDCDKRQSALEGKRDSLSSAEYEIDSQAIASEAQDLRDQLDSDKKQLQRIEKEIAALRKGAADLLALPIEEQLEWADALLGDTPVARHAERLIKLQSEWVNRFNLLRGFRGPLLERSSVVASTCVGLSSVEEASALQFDLCIIDEASKATAMEACVPLGRAKRWVIVGDSMQLPPFRDEVLAHPELRPRRYPDVL